MNPKFKSMFRVWRSAIQPNASVNGRQGRAIPVLVPESTPAMRENVRLSASSHVIQPQLDVILKIPGFPGTAQDAEDVLKMLRFRRAHNTARKLAAEQAIVWCTLELEMMRRSSVSEDDVTTTVVHLRALQCELSAAVDDLAKSHRDIGVVRGLIRSKGLPMPRVVPMEVPSNPPFRPVSRSASDVTSIETSSGMHSEFAETPQ